MSIASRYLSILTCDECGATADSHEANVTGALNLRIWASKNGWRYVQAMVPMPEQHQGHSAVRRSWDFCPACGIPAKLRTTVQVYNTDTRRTELPVTLIGATVSVSYGDDTA